MKLNEPVRSGGIGRKQIAWNTDKNISEQSILEEAANDPASTSAHSPVSTLAETMKLARVAAYSAASSAVANNTNVVWGMQGTSTFDVVPYLGVNFGEGAVKWGSGLYTGSGTVLNTPYLYVSKENNTRIYTNKPGWWLIDCMVSVTNYKNSSNYKLLARVGGDPDILVPGYDIIHTNEYPTLRINTIIPIPAYWKYDNQPQRVLEPYFEIIFIIANGLNNTETIQSEGFIQATWLGPYEQNDTFASN